MSKNARKSNTLQALNAALNLYRTNTDIKDASRVGAPQAAEVPCAADAVLRSVQVDDGVCRFSLFDWAGANGVKQSAAAFSFRRLLKRVPGLGDHVEAVRRANVYGGPTFVDYRLDAVGVLAWLYWRENNGRLPWALFEGRAYV
ncbi:hypothetical protein [Sutterella sp.]|uniref:hypothetical protein n=1 Tax=Sutterella sp. TaxID=1981025 RepID=UPI003FD8BE5D